MIIIRFCYDETLSKPRVTIGKGKRTMRNVDPRVTISRGSCRDCNWWSNPRNEKTSTRAFDKRKREREKDYNSPEIRMLAGATRCRHHVDPQGVAIARVRSRTPREERRHCHPQRRLVVGLSFPGSHNR